MIAPDLRGFGDAPRPQDPKDYARPLLIADVLGILDALGLKQVQLVAHDHGAGLGWRLVAEHPDRFERYVALSVGAPGGSTPIEQREKSWYGALFRQAGVAEEELQRDDWKRSAMGEQPVEIERYIKAQSRPGALHPELNCTVPDGARRAAGHHPGHGDLERRGCVPHGTASENLGERIKGSFRYEKISGASHWMMIDKPEELNRLLLSFLNAGERSQSR